MTESEAIRQIKGHLAVAGCEDLLCDVEALETAIQALSEVEQYRAVGTVEGYKRAVEMSKENYLLYAEYKKKVESFEAIGTIEEFKAIKQWKSDIIESLSKYDVNSVDELMKKFKELTEKAEPKKPIIDDSGHEVYKLCPTCRAHLIGTICCGRCGQRIG